MANRYWVGGTAAWNGTAGTKWALTSGGAGGETVPTSADDVFFDASSGASTVTVSTGNTGAKSITCTGFTGTLALSSGISVAGNITFVSGMTVSGTSGITTTASCTLISGGKSFSLTVSSGTLTQGDAFNFTGRNINVNTGSTYTTSASNFSITCNSFSGNGGTVIFNASTATINSSWSFNSGTFTFGTSTILLSGTSISFVGGARTYNNVTFTGTSSSATCTIDGGNTFNNLTLDAPASTGIISVSFSATQTITTMVCNGASEVRRIFLQSSNQGTARTITATTWTTFTNLDFRDITLTNAKSGTSIGNCLGNTGITFDSPKTVYWNLAGTQNWSATGWATSSGGTPAVANFPLAQDTAVFDNTGSVTGTISVDAGWNLGTMNMSARTSAMTFNSSSATFNIYANWSNGTGTTLTGAVAIIFAGRSAQTITSNGKTFSNGIGVSGVSNSITLADALTTSSSFTLFSTSGLSLGSNTLTASSFSSNTTSTRTIALGTGSITITGSGGSAFIVASTGLTLTGSATISLTSASAKTFAGGNINYGSTINQGGAGALTITGSNTFSDITNTYGATGATAIRFTAGTTTTFTNWSASGTSGKLLTIGSVTASNHTLSKSTGTVNADYLSISRSTATGGATWNALNSIDGGNNSGWIITAAPLVPSNFLMFF